MRHESEELLKTLLRQAWIPEYQVRFRWEAGSVAFWDNRAVQHHAVSDHHPHVRVMERAAIMGTGRSAGPPAGWPAGIRGR